VVTDRSLASGLVMQRHDGGVLGIGRRDGDIDHVAIALGDLRDRCQALPERCRPGATHRWVSVPGQGAADGRRARLTKLIDGCAKQLAAVVGALAGHSRGEGVRVTALLCFDDADLPMWGDLELRGVRLLGPRGTSKLLRRPGTLTEPERRSLHQHLAEALPSA
jgi:hypothetical protein